ncbi:hypothetical protein Y032_0041g384 [Ancylostoma ceylanicum]|uniref:Uncharacterized protein n=1 Tax=Ancylostoma ceylanicum TaxID=53326 RepID=A0A016UGY4_9BILA|nr:hypothetical protein Y032_0041g384 [Ancylostoma ceylanicum]
MFAYFREAFRCPRQRTVLALSRKSCSTSNPSHLHYHTFSLAKRYRESGEVANLLAQHQACTVLKSALLIQSRVASGGPLL